MRQLILYVAGRCAGAEFFGAVKLNKILWKADFDSYAERGVPVTGREYQRLELGPAPKEMAPLHRDMVEAGQIRVEVRKFTNEIEEHRTIALAEPDLSKFNDEDLRFVENSIRYYWNLTGRETSDDSHGAAWKTHYNGDTLFYELSRLSDKPLSQRMYRRLLGRARAAGWLSF
ncbi:MAG TPA: Panacea domain-containing protein [Stellaceae bacterium]|nr:Panacea domain-containing protein [Stellaceae bacterium]